MTVAYLDSSASMKLVIDEAESEALVAALAGSSRRLAASWLLHTELHCVAGRHPAIISIDAITAVLDAVTLVDVTSGDLLAACTHAPLRSNDATHLTTALRIGAAEIVTYGIYARAAAPMAKYHRAPRSLFSVSAASARARTS